MRTLEYRARALLIDSGLPPTFWPYAVKVTTDIGNRTSNKLINFEMPLKLLVTERKLHLDKLKRFGCVAFD